MTHTLSIPQSLINEMIEHAKQACPKEACGILAGANFEAKKLYKMKNIADSQVTYMMDPMEQFKVMKDIRQNNMSMVAIYHSHPCSASYPSPIDINHAYFSGTNEPSYPQAAYIIISLLNKEPEINAFLMEEKTIKKINIHIM